MFLAARLDLIVGKISTSIIQERASSYANAVLKKTNAMQNVIAFIVGTVIGITRLDDQNEENVVCNGHKCGHALKYQLTSPDSLVVHAGGCIECRKHDWTLYVGSGLKEQVLELLLINGRQFVVYGDAGFQRITCLEVLFQSSNLIQYEGNCNKAMSKAHATVEWSFKEVKICFTTMNFKRILRLGNSVIGSLYLAAMILENMRNCVY